MGSGGRVANGGTTGIPGTGGAAASSGTGGTSAGTVGSTGGKAGSTGTGSCTPSKAASANASGSGPHKVTVETNAEPGISEGTIFRPADLGGAEKYPIFVWGEGACERNGLANTAAMGEIASHGYFVIADGTPNGSGNRTMDRAQLAAMGAPLMAYVDWAIAQNDKPCSAYYQSLDTTKIAANGFSCGGLMSQAMVLDARITTWGVTSSGMAGAAQDFYDLVHTPVLFVEGGPSDMAYDGAGQGYTAISKLTVPVLWFSKDLGHGGDLSTARGGDFTKINLAWLNWWLKGDETATGKGLLVGAGCTYCKDSAWQVKSANVP
jgi:dienelactone hydrolase